MAGKFNKASKSDLRKLSSFLQNTQKSSQFTPAVSGGVMHREGVMGTFYYIKLRDQESGEEFFKIGICTTSVAERWGRENGSQFDDEKYSIQFGSRTKKYNTALDVLLIDSWSFPDESPGSSKAFDFEQWVKDVFKPYQATKEYRWSRLKEVVRTGMSELFSRDLYECTELIPTEDVREYIMQKALDMGGELTSEAEARKLVAYIGHEKLLRKQK